MVAIPDVDDVPDPFYSALMIGLDSPELAELLAEPAWQADALCRELPEIDWFPRRGQSSEPAQRACAGCLVRRECLEYALAAGPDLLGVWGGSSGKQRREARQSGWSAERLIEELDKVARERALPAPPSAWETAPCLGCGGNKSRKDIELDDRWCWACRP